MKIKNSLIIGMSVLGLLGQMGFAENRPGAITFTLADAYYRFDSKHHVKNINLQNFALAYNLDQHWAAEGTVGIVNTAQKPAAGNQKVHGFLYTIDGLYRYSQCGYWQPYLLAGIGVLGLKATHDHSTHHGNINGGIGTEFFIDKQIALRGEFRDILTTTGHYKNDLMFNLGISFSFFPTKNVETTTS